MGARGNNPRKKTFAILSVAMLGTAGVAVWMHSGAGWESTDNAQLDGNIVPIRPKITGYLAQVRFQENQRVRKGDTLAVFETTDLRAQVAQVQARLESSLAGIEVSRSGSSSANYGATAAVFSTAAAEQNVASAQARETQTRNDLSRIRALQAQGAATEQALDAVQAAFDMAFAQLRGAKEQLKALMAQRSGAGSQATMQGLQIRAAKAREYEARAQLDAVRDLLSKAYVLAPADGILSRKNAEPGQMVAAGTPLAMLVEDRALWITANFKETQLDKIRPNQPIEATVDAYGDVRIRGRVESLSGATGAKFALLPPDNASGNFIKVTQRVPVRIAISSIDNPRGVELVPGLNAEVSVKVR